MGPQKLELSKTKIYPPLWGTLFLFGLPLTLGLLSWETTPIEARDFPGEIRTFGAMHTKVELQIPTNSGSQESPQTLAELATAVILEADTLFSPSGETSDLRRINEAQVGQIVTINPLTSLLIQEALLWSQKSRGFFDPTIGPLKKLYQFDGNTLKSWPAPQTLQKTLETVGITNLEFDFTRNQIVWKKKGVLDVGGIAKGFTADLVAQVLVSKGVQNALINLGGEMRALGNDPSSPNGNWIIDIDDPSGGQAQYQMEVTNKAIASSGNYNRYFEYQGKRYSHILNPKTGKPLEDYVQGVTVVLPDSATTADVLATLLSILGPTGTEEFLTSLGKTEFPQGVEVVMFLKEADGLNKTLYFSLDSEGNLKITNP
ncbi:MAG: FAD:protein FMN transferase [Deltaproteobacteria bacterium]|jgi:thiamine biosynthesis lipoprotein|nr:FAD:protein FMN transferase [Deltaproteobacteria bacterium]